MAFQHLLLDVQDRVGTLTLNRPDKRNALNYILIDELKQGLDLLAQNPDVKIIRLKGSGEAFCAGADLDYLRQLQAFSLDENLADSQHLAGLFLTIYKLNKPIVAQVEGHALAGGCGLATVCDFVFAVPEAKFGYTEVKIGFLPAIVTVFLLRRIGEGRAKELLLSGELISAATAERYGMVNWLADKADIDTRVWDFCQRLCANNATGSMEYTKRLIADLQDMPLMDALNFAVKLNAHARSTDECKTGINAFLNKEKLVW